MATENHPVVSALTRMALRAPLAKSAARIGTRLAIQRLPLKEKNKERIYNLLAAEAASDTIVNCYVGMPGGGHIVLELNLSDEASRSWYYWGYRHYEEGTERLWWHLLKHAGTVFDVGANIGRYTFLAAMRLRERGTIHSFEPNREAFRGLSGNLRRNEMTNALANEIALCDRDGKATFYLPKNREWCVGSLIEGFACQTEPITVDVMRLDTYCAKFGIKKIDLIKMDVEGAELKVLKGMGSLLLNWKPDIICEVLEGYDAPLSEFFEATPYRKFLIADDGSLRETNTLKAHTNLRDYYLTCSPGCPSIAAPEMAARRLAKS
jgi:FkbM family methyltransferase